MRFTQEKQLTQHSVNLLLVIFLTKMIAKKYNNNKLCLVMPRLIEIKIMPGRKAKFYFRKRYNWTFFSLFTFTLLRGQM